MHLIQAHILVHDITICVHSIISSASNIMTKAQDIATFAHAITICVHNILLYDWRESSLLIGPICLTEMHFLLQKNLKNIMHGRVKMYVMR